MSSNDWLTPEGAAAHIGMSVPFVRRLYRSGQIQAYKPGGKVRIRTAELDAWLDRQKIAGASRRTEAPRAGVADRAHGRPLATTRG